MMLDGVAQGVDLSDLHRSVGDCFLSDRMMSPRCCWIWRRGVRRVSRVAGRAARVDGLDRRLLPEWLAGTRPIRSIASRCRLRS